MSTEKMTVEVIGCNGCTGYSEKIPEIVRQFAIKTNIEIEFRVYRAWEIEAGSNTPGYIWDKIKRVRAGKDHPWGFFLNGNWISVTPHQTNEALAAYQALESAAAISSQTVNEHWYAKEFDKIKINYSALKNVNFGDSVIDELGFFSTRIGRAWFFEGSIKKLSIDCTVDEFRYQGYDIKKLIHIAEQHPELFSAAKIASAEPNESKANLNEITIHLITGQTLAEGRHPCPIMGFKIDPQSFLHQAIAERFGGWGYVAWHISQPCGFLGILPKDLAQQNADGLIPPTADIPANKILLISCVAGGSVYGIKYSGIGIATKMIRQMMVDAKQKGYQYI
ncbi:MAG TPA: hypothetical protein VHY08_10715, partial [Bacillota bacterium]|nr:hypothetical protein [Bacillota bacterium]